MRLKYRIRRLFKKHDELVCEIYRLIQWKAQLKANMRYYDNLMGYGYLGDSLWENRRIVSCALRDTEKEIEIKKSLWRLKKWQG